MHLFSSCDNWKNCADGSDEVPELCLITRARMQVMWEKAEQLSAAASENGRSPLDDDLIFESYQPIHSMISLTRRPTYGTTLRPRELRSSSTSTSAKNLFPAYEIATQAPANIENIPQPSSTESSYKFYTPKDVASIDPNEAGADFTLPGPPEPSISSNIPDIGHEELTKLQNVQRNLNKLNAIKNCTLPAIPRNAAAEIASCRANRDAHYCNSNITIVPYGSQIIYECSPGYLLNGPISIACTRSGTWTSPPPTCEASKLLLFRKSKRLFSF